MNCRHIASVAALLAIVAHAPKTAPGQPMAIETDTVVEIAPDVSAAGNRLDSLFRQQMESVKRSYLIVLLRESIGDNVERDEQPNQSVRLHVYMRVLPESENDLPRGFNYSELHNPENAFSPFEAGALPDLPESSSVGVTEIGVPPSFEWEIDFFDGKNKFKWGDDYYQRYYKSAPIGVGYTGDLYVAHRPSAPSRDASLAPRWLSGSAHCILYRDNYTTGYQSLINQLKQNTLDDNINVLYVVDNQNPEGVIMFQSETNHADPGHLAENPVTLKMSASLRSGLPVNIEYQLERQDGSLAFHSERWHIGSFRTGSGRLLYYPNAWDIISSSSSWLSRVTPTLNEDGTEGFEIERVDMGLRVQRVRTIVLHAEFDEPWHLDHPALEPDSLASWLGVALQWTNPEGATVTSVPPEADANQGIPHCELLMDLRQQVKDGDLVIEWPFDEPAAPASEPGQAAAP